jgi:hypothetical protein
MPARCIAHARGWCGAVGSTPNLGPFGPGFDPCPLPAPTLCSVPGGGARVVWPLTTWLVNKSAWGPPSPVRCIARAHAPGARHHPGWRRGRGGGCLGEAGRLFAARGGEAFRRHFAVFSRAGDAFPRFDVCMALRLFSLGCMGTTHRCFYQNPVECLEHGLLE